MRKLISTIFGSVAGVKFPKFIQNFINKRYIKFFNINLEEFKEANEYESLNALFTRHLVKPRCLENASFIAPCDGVLLQTGTTKNHKAFSIKDRVYSVSDLLNKSPKSELKYANIYLSPRDYHHYHAPCDMEILSATIIPGDLCSVAKKALFKTDNLYAKNERVVLETKLKNGKNMWLVFVGALNVGSMKFDFDKRIETNSKLREVTTFSYKELFFQRGEHLGNFKLGSTIVILAEANGVEFCVKESEVLKFGDKFGKVVE